MRYIEDLKEDEKVIGHYLCKQKQNLKSKSGKTYLSLKLQDKTGVIVAKVWDLNKDIQNFEENQFIKIDGTVLTYQNEPQMKITKIRRSMEGEYDPMDYIPCTDKDVNSLYNQIVDYIKTINNPYMRQLLENLVVKNSEIARLLKVTSAGKNMHHSYMGGLIEHTLSIVQICDFMSTRYKFVNRDLLISTAILHDLGKIYELSEFPINDYTDDGQLLGHIIICSEMVTKESNKIEGFPHSLQSLIKHSILAHHGELEYGSPKTPKTIEAFILHCADNMDAKIKMFEEMLENDNTPGDWAGYNKALSRNIRKSNILQT